jgi:hypothetical protein
VDPSRHRIEQNLPGHAVGAGHPPIGQTVANELRRRGVDVIVGAAVEAIGQLAKRAGSIVRRCATTTGGANKDDLHLRAYAKMMEVERRIADLEQIRHGLRAA